MSRKVMVVDDEPKIRLLLSLALKKAGFAVVEAGDGQIALEKIPGEQPHLIISDINMPNMDGWEFCWNLRRTEEFKEIPLVFLTTRSEVPDRIRGLESGADDFISKPFDAVELVARVKVILKRVYGEDLPPLDISALPTDMIISKRYQIKKLVGRGGMGSVYRANDKELGVEVAMKFLKPELGRDPIVLQRFKREIVLARKIVHHNVVRIHDLGEHRGTRYISMEYITGKSLKFKIRKFGAMSVEETVSIVKPICSALEAIHALDIIHRDLKPQNILIDEQGIVKVVDFGIAHGGDSTEITTSGGLIGTPAYMSPEQVSGDPVDRRSDLYSFGIIMFEMLSGKLPFYSDLPAALVMKHLTDEAPILADVLPQIPQKFSDIVAKLMEKNPDQRYNSVQELMAEIDTLS
ncbi:protein kinase [candidate division CSSED10-310 bacterium]|uniref:Protein kinase n=1 Tax=candidate division CSSED10-310 bacterium TaxID=2855610 RepID=A0ABV6YWF8_UNCC1